MHTMVSFDPQHPGTRPGTRECPTVTVEGCEEMFAGPSDTNAPSGASDLSILTTEHFTLQSSRQLCLQDIQGRSTIFLTVLSVSLLAIGYFGTATHFGSAYVA